jgi:glucose/arabinose dehydrogenase
MQERRIDRTKLRPNVRLLIWAIVAASSLLACRTGSSAAAEDEDPSFNYLGQKPGQMHKITAQQLAPPNATSSASNSPRTITRPANAWPQAPTGFKVELFADGLQSPRQIRTAPNGDIFVAESSAGLIRVFRVGSDGKPQQGVFADGLNRPFGIAFFPPGPEPRYIYVGNTDSVVRFPYHNGDLKNHGAPEVIVPRLPTGGHWTRDVAFSLDGKKMFVAVGSRSNVNDDSAEFQRANILVANPDGSGLRVFASGIRNPVGLAVDPQTGELWCSVNERDELGDNLPPDYITHVQEGGFYGWPWYYTGGNQDPRHQGKHPELKSKVLVPDVLVQAHSASLGMTFYTGRQFPNEYTGNIFAAEHGSWNRNVRTGYKVIRVPVKNGRATGEYEDFLTGFVTPDGQVWGRPVGVAVAQDGSLLVTDDASRSIWRISFTGAGK